MTHKDLIDAGYKGFPTGGNNELYKLADHFFQKRIEENGVTLFFIDVYWYDWEKLPNGHKRPPSAMFEANLYPDEGRNMVLVFHRDERPIAEIEADFRRVYDFMNCIPDPHNQRG